MIEKRGKRSGVSVLIFQTFEIISNQLPQKARQRKKNY